MIIRPATTADCPAIAAIWNPVIRDSLLTFNSREKSPQDLDLMLQHKATADQCFVLAEDAQGVLGFATYGQFRAGVGYALTMEHTIILAPDARRKGIGRRLMQAVEDHAQARGTHSMFAGVSSENRHAVAFHAALGYTEVARLPQVGFKLGQWLDLILLQKFLS